MKKERAVIYTELTDPVWPSGNDPWVVRREDSYYYCWSTASGVHVRAIRDLSDLADEGGSTVYSASGSWTDGYCLGQLTLTGEAPWKAPAGTAAAAGRSRSSGTGRPWSWAIPPSPANRSPWLFLNE